MFITQSFKVIYEFFSGELKDLFVRLKERVQTVRKTIVELSEQSGPVQRLDENSAASGDNVVVILEESSVTVVPDALLEDTRKTLTDLQRISGDPSARIVLEPLLPHAIALYEITNEELLSKLKQELTEEDRTRLQHCVVRINHCIVEGVLNKIRFPASFGADRRSSHRSFGLRDADSWRASTIRAQRPLGAFAVQRGRHASTGYG